MNHSKKITDGGLLLALFTLLLLGVIFFPTIALIIVFLLPIPFILYAQKYNWQSAIWFVFGAIVLSFILATVYSVPITIFVSLGGIMIGTSLYKQLKPYETLARGTVGYTIGLLFAYLFSQYFFQINWARELEEAMEESLKTSFAIFEQFDLLQTDISLELILEQISYVTKLIPAAMVIVSLLFAWITQWLSFKLINRMQRKTLKFPPFRHFKLPTALIWLYFIALIFLLFNLNQDDILFTMASNAQVLVGFLMTLQGFSFIFYYTHYKNWPRFIPFLSIFLSVIIPYLFLYAIRLLGIIDIGFQLREKLTEKRG